MSEQFEAALEAAEKHLGWACRQEFFTAGWKAALQAGGQEPSASPVYDQSVVKRLATQMGWTPPSASPAALTVPDEEIEATTQSIARFLLGDVRKVDCDIISSHIRALLAAQPAETVKPDECAQDVYQHGVSIGLFNIPKETANAICAGIALVTGARVDWHYIAGRVHMKAIANSAASAAPPHPDRQGVALSAELREKLIELANELDSELDSGANWTKAQHTCCSVSGALRDLSRASSSRAEVERDAAQAAIDGLAERMMQLQALMKAGKAELPAMTEWQALNQLRNRVRAMLAAAEAPSGENRTLYDERNKVWEAIERAAPRLYWALKDLLEAVNERPDQCGIESVVINAAQGALLAAEAPNGEKR